MFRLIVFLVDGNTPNKEFGFPETGSHLTIILKIIRVMQVFR
jgi:hypothetical protein